MLTKIIVQKDLQLHPILTDTKYVEDACFKRDESNGPNKLTNTTKKQCKR